uniref:Carbonic anhydrase n=1 Tax=Plectus sambesii TaxID=2011161 RepID=A0A914WFY8_9BILA
RVEQIDPIRFVNYERPVEGKFVNNGHSVQVNIPNYSEDPEIFGGELDQVYRLIQYHFHWGQQDHEGSEHTLAGLRYPAELHLVHQGVDDPSKLAVLGVFLKLAPDGEALESEAQHLDEIVEPNSATTIAHIILKKKLPKNTKSFWRYHGSLTTPPCSECVTWTIFTEPVNITKEQLAKLRQIKDVECEPLRKNYRPVQPLNKRQVRHVLAK